MKKNTGSTLQGITRLVSHATIEATNVVEAMHHQVVHPPFLPSTRIQHLITSISSFTYQGIRLGTRVIGRSLDKILGKLAPFLGEIKATNDREAVLSVLNGVVGDYLEKEENPLQLEMQFRCQGKSLSIARKSIEKTYPNYNGKILLLVHGSCMNDLQWTRAEHNHGLQLGQDLGKTPIYLQYNSGRHISENGQDLNGLLEKLVSEWPAPVEELTVLAHSMGGLVTRSALYYGQQQQKSWTKQLKKIVFLGTPHHGAPLERIGNYVDVIMGGIPYAKPFARLAKIRSAGVTDLRYGNLIRSDWEGKERFKIQKDSRQAIPLPKQVECYSIAAVYGKTSAGKTGQMLGDTLVNVKSALGKHKDPAKSLNFKEDHTWISYETSHLDLLSNVKVYTKIKAWLEI